MIPVPHLQRRSPAPLASLRYTYPFRPRSLIRHTPSRRSLSMDRRRFLQTAAATTLVGALEKKLARGDAKPVPKRTLGRSGEKVSMVGIGGYHLGMQSDEQESIRIIRTAIDNGINF